MTDAGGIPAGLCQCGCGRTTSLILRNNAGKGLVAGEYRRFVVGHRMWPDRPVLERFMDRVDKQDGTGCWLWRGAIDGTGYGKWIPSHREQLIAHRFAYEQLVGPIPEGLTIDHLCRNRSCVNPAHLEPVTNVENVMRGMSPLAQNARKTHCKHGHPLSGPNLVVRERPGRAPCRECRQCARDKSRRQREAAK